MTLLEALIVVTLTVLIGLIAFPSVEKTYGILTLHQAADAMAANLRIAQAEAMDSGQNVVFTLQSDGHGYSWSGEARRTPAAVDLEMSKGQDIQFFADGSTSGGAIALADGAHRVDISVDAATGAITATP
jgi:general secretion pathway protein H